MRRCPVVVIAALSFSMAMAQVSVQPDNFYVSFPGGSATFLCSCLCPSAMWLINDTLLENPESLNAEVDSFGERGRLRLFNISPSFNMTLIKCRVELESGEIETSINGTLLLLQGNISVGALAAETQGLEIIATWTAPFTLLPDPDITYCVDVENATSSIVLHSECGITETRFIYPIPPGTNCHMLYFTVVPDGRIGHPNAVSTTHQALETVPELVPGGLTTLQTHTCDVIIVQLLMTAPVCAAQLTCMDFNTGEIIAITDDGLLFSTENSTIVFGADKLTANRHYSLKRAMLQAWPHLIPH